MSKTCTYYQPEYVSRFHCDGQKCSAKCCRNWQIFIDKKTYKKYSHIKPKSAANEITRFITKRENLEEYMIKLDENFNCPFLTDDNWCSIQRKHGEEFLSEICRTYPRRIWDFKTFRERSLVLTCPIAAELILLSDESLKFEEVTDNYTIQKLIPVNCSAEFIDQVLKIQRTATAILQDRNLTIDKRLMMLGLYCDKLDELFDNDRIDELEAVNLAYQSSKFLQEQSAQFSAVLKFDVHNYIKIVMELLNSLYGKDSGVLQGQGERIILDAITETLNLLSNETEQFKISEVAKRYSELNFEREKFVSGVSTILENYLVNEFFMNLYPFRFESNKAFNYGMFVATYKMLELVTFSMARANYSSNEDLISQIIWYSANIDHNQSYVNKISEYMKDKSDIVQIMQNMLQV